MEYDGYSCPKCNQNFLLISNDLLDQKETDLVQMLINILITILVRMRFFYFMIFYL